MQPWIRLLPYTCLSTLSAPTVYLKQCPWRYGVFRSFSGTQNTKIQLRNPYFRKAGFYWWRRQQIRSRNEKRASKRHIWPKGEAEGEMKAEGVFAKTSRMDDKEWIFTARDIKISIKRLKMFARLIKGLHLQDALDWLAAIPIIRINPLYNLLSQARMRCTQKFNAEIERLFIKTVVVNYGPPMKFLRCQKNGKYFIMKSWRNRVVVTLRHMPLNELFHRYYILTKVPKSMAMDMRFALHEKRVDPQTLYEWYPYLNSHTRYWHRQNLKWLSRTNQFDYTETRRLWQSRYRMNILRQVNELRISRGLLPKTGDSL